MKGKAIIPKKDRDEQIKASYATARKTAKELDQALKNASLFPTTGISIFDQTSDLQRLATTSEDILCTTRYGTRWITQVS